MKILYYILPVIAGAAMAVQSGINAQLRGAIQNPFVAAFISFLGGTLALAAMLLFSRQALPPLSVYPTVSWYKFIGGFLGVFVVVIALSSVQKIGASNMFVLIIAGQLLTAVVMDHFGVLGLKTSPVTLQKIAGITLLVAGTYLVNRK